jgi:hypothetical protein
VALEKPYSIGFFASQLSLAEREGLAPERSLKPFQTSLSFNFMGS